MARVSQYKALGTKLGGYKSTLSKIESKEYGKKHADWKAQEQISLYNQIGGTVANVIGIAQESRLAREQADTSAREFGIDPGGKFAKRVTKVGKEQNPWLKLSEEAQDEAFWADENMSDRVVGPKPDAFTILPLEDTQSSLFEGEPGETSPIPDQRTEVADDKVFNAMADPSRAGDIERIRGLGEELEFGHVLAEKYDTYKPEKYPSSSYTKAEQYPTSATAGKKGVDQEYVGMIETERDEETPMGHVVRQRQKDIFSTLLKPERPKVSTVDEQPSPITNDMAFDAIAEPSLGDFDKSKLPSVDPVRDAVLAKFKGSGATSEKIDQIAQEFASVETGGKNIRQVTNEDIAAGRTEGTGPASGIFQFEGKKGSNEFKTALQRMKNMYDPSRKISGMEGAKYPKWIDEALKHGSAMKLTKDQQKSLLLANLFMKEGSDSLLQKGFGSGDFSELYTDIHYAGAKGDSLARAQKIEDYKRRREDVK